MNNLESIIGKYKISQVGYLVRDMDAAIAKFSAFLGKSYDSRSTTGPYEESQCTYHGARCDGRADCAFFDVGDNMQIELIQPDDAPSCWHDDLPAYEMRIHHIAFDIKDMKTQIARCEAAGLKCIQTGEWGTGRYAYIDADTIFGCRLELLEHDTKPL